MRNEQNTENKTGNDEGTNKRHFYNFQPNTEMFADVSNDGKYIIFKVVFTFIKPRKYLDTILRNFFKTDAEKSSGTLA